MQYVPATMMLLRVRSLNAAHNKILFIQNEEDTIRGKLWKIVEVKKESAELNLG